jgi:hypothetical protein
MNLRISLLVGVLAACVSGCDSASSGAGGAGEGGGAGGVLDGEGGGGGERDVCADIACEDVPTFEELSWSLCTSCHASDAETRASEGVPADSDYTRYEGVSTRIREIANRVNATSAPMPPSGSEEPTDDEKEAFTKWSCCDGPE